MERPAIILHIGSKDYPNTGDDYQGLSSLDLEKLLQESREMVLSFETELTKRAGAIINTTDVNSELYNKLRTQAEDLRNLWSFRCQSREAA